MAAAGLRASHDETVEAESQVALSFKGPMSAISELDLAGPNDYFSKLARGMYSANVSLTTASKLMKSEKISKISKIETKKRRLLHLDNANTQIGLHVPATGQRAISETGTGVVIGVVDSGFDLTHPMFRDGSGNLRVDALLDQYTGKEFSTAELESGWNGVLNPSGPGGDENGHGTHVATIAGGTLHKGG